MGKEGGGGAVSSSGPAPVCRARGFLPISGEAEELVPGGGRHGGSVLCGGPPSLSLRPALLFQGSGQRSGAPPGTKHHHGKAGRALQRSADQSDFDGGLTAL